jgi:hypothetical protein
MSSEAETFLTEELPFKMHSSFQPGQHLIDSGGQAGWLDFMQPHVAETSSCMQGKRSFFSP